MEETNLATKAIKSALLNNWEEAVKYNLLILKNQPNDIEAWLRLAKAYEELGETQQSKKAYQKALSLDRLNPIARRGIIRLNQEQNTPSSFSPQLINNNQLFLEEPGKTKTISLIKLAPPKILLKLKVAEEVKLCVGKRSISVRNRQNQYLGRLPDDISLRLIKLIKNGNQYLAVVKAVDEKNLQIFIRETKRSPKNQSLLSFPPSSDSYHSFVPSVIFEEE